MWIFTDNGFLSLTQHPEEPELLVVQSREEMDGVVKTLDDIADEKHKLLPAVEPGCRFAVVARRQDVARVVSRMVTEIGYCTFTQSAHFDFGVDPKFILLVNDGNLQLARIRPY